MILMHSDFIENKECKVLLKDNLLHFYYGDDIEVGTYEYSPDCDHLCMSALLKYFIENYIAEELLHEYLSFDD